MQTELVYITPSNVGGHPECFMSIRECPICGCCNEDTFLIDGQEYYCEGCNKTLEYKAINPHNPKIKQPKKRELLYTYLITRNGL